MCSYSLGEINTSQYLLPAGKLTIVDKKIQKDTLYSRIILKLIVGRRL